MKCKTCGDEKEMIEFALSQEGYRMKRCRACEAKRKNALYLKDKDAYKIRARLHDKRKRDENRLLIDNYRAANACKHCGESDTCCLDFHHIDGTTKAYSFGRLRKKGYATKTILAELAKCIILCANCHRKYHAGRFQLDNDAD